MPLTPEEEARLKQLEAEVAAEDLNMSNANKNLMAAQLLEANKANNPLEEPQTFEELEEVDTLSKLVKEDHKNGQAIIDFKTMHPEIDGFDRLRVQNLMDHSPRSALEYLRTVEVSKGVQKYPGWQFAVNDGEIIAQKPGDKNFRVLDPAWTEFSDWPKDLADVAYSLPTGQINAALGAAAGTAVYAGSKNPRAALATGMATTGALEGLATQAKQWIANREYGTPYNPSEVAFNTGIGAATMGISGVAPPVKTMIKKGFSEAEQAALSNVALGKKIKDFVEPTYSSGKNFFKEQLTGIAAESWKLLDKINNYKWVQAAAAKIKNNPKSGVLLDEITRAKNAIKVNPNDQVAKEALETSLNRIAVEIGPAHEVVQSAVREMDKAKEVARAIGREIPRGIEKAEREFAANNANRTLTIDVGDIVHDLDLSLMEQVANRSGGLDKTSERLLASYGKVMDEFRRGGKLPKIGQTQLPGGGTQSAPGKLKMTLSEAHHLTQTLADLAGFYKDAPNSTGVADEALGMSAKNIERLATDTWKLVNKRVNYLLPQETRAARTQYHEIMEATGVVGNLLRNKSQAFLKLRNARESVNHIPVEAMKLLDAQSGTKFYDDVLAKAMLYKDFAEPRLGPQSSLGVTATARALTAGYFASQVGELASELTNIGAIAKPVAGVVGMLSTSPAVNKGLVGAKHGVSSALSKATIGGANVIPTIGMTAAKEEGYDKAYNKGLNLWENIQKEKLKGRIP